MEEKQSKPHHSRRLASQPSLTLEMKPFQAKQSHLIESNSPGLFETCVSTSSETPVTLIISGTSTFREEVPQLQEDIRTNPSVMVNTYILEPAPSRDDSEGVTPPTSVAQILYLLRRQRYFTDPTVYLFHLD